MFEFLENLGFGEVELFSFGHVSYFFFGVIIGGFVFSVKFDTLI